MEELRGIKESIREAFDDLRAELFEAELEELIASGLSEKKLEEILAKYSIPIGSFMILSAIRRSGMSLGDFIRSSGFLFTRHVIISHIVSQELREGSKILEIGCGRGLNICALALKGYNVYGVDVSGEALDVARRLAEKMGCRVHLRLVDGVRLPFRPEFFDAVLYAWTIHEMEPKSIEESLSEAVRVLREEGTIYIIDQEEIAPFSLVDSITGSLGLRLAYEKALSPVYDHGKASRAILRKYVKA